MAVFTMEILIRNPVNGESKRVFRQLNPANVTIAKWDSFYTNAVGPAIDELVASDAATPTQTL